ncbi:MAG: discoidin domain-containing protein [Actinocrinis sp.]
MAVSRRGFLSTGATLLAGFGAGAVLPDERADATTGEAVASGLGAASDATADLASYRSLTVSAARHAPATVQFATGRLSAVGAGSGPRRAGLLAAAGESHWVAVDLRAPCTVEAVTLVFEAASDADLDADIDGDRDGDGGASVAFELEVSSDGDDWTPVYQATTLHGLSRTGGQVDVELPSPVDAQWIRVTTSMAHPDAIPVNLNGIQVYGTWRGDQPGAAGNDADADVRAQVADYENTRAVFETWNAKLWNSASGLSRPTSVSQPALHSTVWQSAEDDPDVSGAYYGSRKGSEPVHVQAHPGTWQVLAANHTARALHGASITARVYDMAGRQFSQIEQQGMNIPASSSVPGFVIGWPMSSPLPQLLRLELLDCDGVALSQNTYWRDPATQDVHALDSLARTRLALSVSDRRMDDDGRGRLTATVTNRGATVAAMVRLALRDGIDACVLPARYDDNYFWLLPGESREVAISWPVGAASDSTSQHPQVVAQAYNAGARIGR